MYNVLWDQEGGKSTSYIWIRQKSPSQSRKNVYFFVNWTFMTKQKDSFSILTRRRSVIDSNHRKTLCAPYPASRPIRFAKSVFTRLNMTIWSLCQTAYQNLFWLLLGQLLVLLLHILAFLHVEGEAVRPAGNCWHSPAQEKKKRGYRYLQ